MSLPAPLAGYDVCAAYISGAGCLYQNYLTSGNAVGYRSSAYAGAQKITIDYQVWEYRSGGWYKYGDYQRRAATIPSGYSSVQVTGFNKSVLSGYWYVTAQVAWWRADNNALLGYRNFTWNGSTDYACRTGVVECRTGPGWIYLG